MNWRLVIVLAVLAGVLFGTGYLALNSELNYRCSKRANLMLIQLAADPSAAVQMYPDTEGDLQVRIGERTYTYPAWCANRRTF